MSSKNPIRVITVDDLPLMRSGLRLFLEAYHEFSLVGEASNGEEAVQLCELLKPDVVIMDLKMPVMDGVEATRQIISRWPEVKILALVSFRDNELVEEALNAGARAYAFKDLTADELVDHIHRMVVGGSQLPDSLRHSPEQTETLERLGQAMEMAASDRTLLAGVLRAQLPPLFPGCQIEVCVFPNQNLLCYPADRPESFMEPAWRWMQNHLDAHVFTLGEILPWGDIIPGEGQLMVAPLITYSGNALGGIGVLQYGRALDLQTRVSFAKQFALKLAQVIEKARQEEPASFGIRMDQELANAGKIQSGILPEHPPQLRGWEMAARLESAKQTSGDFFDFIPLTNSNWGFVIADVSDKGIGAALFMALSSTLLRTYATQYATLPSFVISQVNDRILSDTRSEMFVTAFYGILEPDTGRFRYVNAGHNPPYLISSQKGKPFDRLRATGMALGVMEDSVWNQKVARFSPGDVLLLYTDGITEAQNAVGQFYGEHRLQAVLRSLGSRPAEEILEMLLDDLRRFTGGVPQQDDVTLIVIRRNPAT